MKKLFVLLLTLVIVFSITACGSQSVKNEDTSENSKNSVEDNTSQQEATDSTESFFTTEYEVVDYVENAIIVSKNDGLLYGLIDNKGNEIIPVKYDEMEFFNKDDYIDGYYDIYIWCKYEDTDYIFDAKGEKVVESQKKISYVDSMPKASNSPLFAFDNSDDSTNVYDKNMNLIGTTYKEIVNSCNNYIISNICYFRTELLHGLLYDYKGNLLKDFGNRCMGCYLNDNKCIILIDENEKFNPESNILVYHIDVNNGNIIKEETMSFYDAKDKYQTSEKEYYNLYESNSTYKMEDLEGNPLYAERYYKKLSVEGENDCVFLTDEDDSVCVFGRQGNLYAEFGIFTGRDNTLYLMSQNGDIKVSAVHEGKESIAVVISSSNGSEIHFFS